MGTLLRAGAFVLLSAAALNNVSAQAPAPLKTAITYADVQPIWELLRPQLPPTLASATAETRESAFHGWARAQDADIRGRVARGDEDSLVNLWLFGTSFTDLPPARPRDVAMSGDGATLAQISDGRLVDFLAALASPGAPGLATSARGRPPHWEPSLPRGEVVLGRGLEPLRLSAYAPQTYVSAIPPPELFVGRSR